MPRERAKERACDKAIQRTLAYRAVFKYPLTYNQLCTTLIPREKFDKRLFDKELNKLVKKSYIGYREGKYSYRGIKPVSWDYRAKYAEHALKKAENIAKILSLIPWIQLLCVTGSAAAYNSDRESDIDIFVITKTHRLWLTRGFVSLLLKTMGVYAQNGIGPNKICPNLYIDDFVLDWPINQQSVFTAHEIMLMHPLIDRNNTYFRFLAANRWINDFLGCTRIEIDPADLHHSQRDSLGQSRIINLFEKIACNIQLAYMKKKRTNEVIDEHMIHFRKNDNTNWILEEFGRLSKI